jgi:phospholipase C
MPAKFDHLVVLMMENRSFDHMLGRLYHHDNPDPYHVIPRGQVFDGVSDTMFNTTTLSPAPGQPGNIFAHRATHFATPSDFGPAHDFDDVFVQINGLLPAGTRMDGFVLNRAANLQSSQHITASHSQLADVMAGFSPTTHTADAKGNFADAHVLCTLARQYAVCDNWHSSIPGPTFPNRSFLHAGTSNGFVSNGPVIKWSFQFAPTVFNRLLDKKLTAKVYHSGSGPPLFGIDVPNAPTYPALVYELHPTISHVPHASLNQFKIDALSGDLPSYSFIEPEIIGDDTNWHPNDQHPVRDIRWGEELIRFVYKAVREGKNWDRTFLVITYDEHGGFFDHRYPPEATAPGFGNFEEGFTFTQFGVRVPAVLVSPFIEEGTVFHPKCPVDHTSVIRTLCARFGLNGLTPRDALACDLSAVLGNHLRTDSPVIAPVHVPSSVEKKDQPLNDLQLDYLAIVAANRNLELPPIQMESEGRAFLNTVSVLPPQRKVN